MTPTNLNADTQAAKFTQLYQLFVTYDNHKGGVNNLQVCKICPIGKPFNAIRVYSSIKGDEAINRAKRWAKKNNIEILQTTC